jgi:hypothetical protein
VGIISASVIPTNILKKLIRLYCYSQKSYPDEKSVAHISKLSETLANGTYKQVAMNVSISVEEGESTLPTDISPGNHWVTLTLDIERTSLLYRLIPASTTRQTSGCPIVVVTTSFHIQCKLYCACIASNLLFPNS